MKEVVVLLGLLLLSLFITQYIYYGSDSYEVMIVTGVGLLVYIVSMFLWYVIEELYRKYDKNKTLIKYAKRHRDRKPSKEVITYAGQVGVIQLDIIKEAQEKGLRKVQYGIEDRQESIKNLEKEIKELMDIEKEFKNE